MVRIEGFIYEGAGRANNSWDSGSSGNLWDFSRERRFLARWRSFEKVWGSGWDSREISRIGSGEGDGDGRRWLGSRYRVFIELLRESLI